MTKSIEEQREELAKKYVSLSAPEMTRLQMLWDFKNGFDAGAKARDVQWQAVVNELRDSLSKILPEVYCLYLQETGLRLDKVGEKYDTVKIKYDRSKLALTKADQLLKEMGLND